MLLFNLRVDCIWLCLHEQLRSVSNSVSPQICIWPWCCGYRLLPVPMNPSRSSYITRVIFPWMPCHAFKSNCLWNVLIPSDGLWRRQKGLREKEKRDPRHKGKKTPAQLAWNEVRSHDLNILGDEICPHCRDSFLRQTCSFSGVRGVCQWSQCLQSYCAASWSIVLQWSLWNLWKKYCICLSNIT